MKRLLSRLARCMGVVLYKFSFHIHADSACGFRQTISGAGLEAGPQQFFPEWSARPCLQRIHRRLTIGGGNPQVDRHVPNSDPYGQGNRVFSDSHLTINQALAVQT